MRTTPMRDIKLKPLTAAIAAGAVLSFSLCACQGRRASDPLPDGDTVEVVINSVSSADEDADSSATSDSTKNEI